MVPEARRTSPTPAPSWSASIRKSAARAIARARDLQVAYADDTWSPLSDITLGLLLKRAGIRWEYVALEGLAEVVWPPVCGCHRMFVERQQLPGERRFAVRHGLGHVLAGHVAELAFARDGHDWRGFEESVADLFAWADLIPDRMLEELRGAGYAGAELERWVYCEMRRYVPSWPADRVVDRVGLRLHLQADSTRG